MDDQDLQIVKSYGRATGLLKKGNDQRFPKFETWREQVDGKYWFPVLTKADDTLQFDAGPVGLKMQVKYEDYKLAFTNDLLNAVFQERDPHTGTLIDNATRTVSGAPLRR